MPHDKTMKYWWAFIARVREVVQWYNPLNQPTLEDCVLAFERQAEKDFYDILGDGGAGSEEAVAAHDEWMIARTQRATMDAQTFYLSIAF